MQQILQAIKDSGYTLAEQSTISVADNQVANLAAINLAQSTIEVGESAQLNLILMCGGSLSESLTISLAQGARLNIIQACVGVSSVIINVLHGTGAESKIIAASISNNKVTYNLELNKPNGFCQIDTVQMGSDKDNNSIDINMRHMSADCSSRSLSKCVASVDSSLQFNGLVYVAKDAQRTSAMQNCRSIELSNSSHIVAHPQLEIYADDVKCSHGATMGQVDTDAILYMRQRGLSEAQARRVQIEGFVTDIVDRCDTPIICDAIRALILHKLEEM